MLAVLLSAVFMAQFDFFVVNVAAPSLQRDLHAGEGALELVVGGYAFAYAGAMITSGRLGDLFGHRRMFATGALAFALTSALCAVATSPGQLIAARLAQGVAGAMTVPQVLALITAAFPAEIRPRALGWYSATAGLGSIAGQVLGGLLLEANVAGLGWRVIFLINVPIGAVVCPLALRLLPEHGDRGRARLDPVGALGVAGALALVLVPLSLGRADGWPAWTWIAVGAALPVALATWRWERLLGRRGGTPVLELALLRSSSFVAGLAAGAAFMFSFASLMFTLTLLLQDGLGLDALQAGLVFSPMGATFAIGALSGRKLVERHGLRAVVPGSLLVATGLALLVARLAIAGSGVGVPSIVLALSIAGLGNGLVLPSLIGVALVGVRPKDAGAASGMFVTAQQFAGAVGVAAIGALFFSALDGGRSAYAAMTWAGASCVAATLGVTALVALIARIDYEASVSAL